MDNYDWQDKVVIITGGAGFIGSHLTQRLLELGARVVVVDNFLTGKRENLASLQQHATLQLQEVDVNNQEQWWAVLAQVKQQYGRIDFVFHLASPASPPLYQRYPTQTYLVNTLALHNLLTWLREQQSEARVIFASTSEVYGDPQVHPQTEDYWGHVNPNGVRSCYDESKRLGETIAGVFGRDFGMDVRMMRIFNTYGPRMDLDDGRVLPQFIKQTLAGEKLTVYGDGNQTRSYCYVTDLVAGIVKLAASEQAVRATVNLGNPGEYTVLETAKIMNKLVGRSEDEIEYRPLPQDDPAKRRPDISKAKKLLDWQPEIDFETGLRLMWESYQK